MKKMTTSPAKAAQAAVAAIYAECESWRWTTQILEERTGKRFDRALLNRVARGKQAAPNSLLFALGLPVTAPAPVCPIHGVPHTTKRCPQPKRRRDWLDWPVGELAALVRGATHG